MSQENHPVTAPSETESSAATTEATTSTGAPTKAASGSYTAASSVSSMSDLKQKAPEVYDAMMMGIGITIVNRMKRSQDHLKKPCAKLEETPVINNLN